MKYNGIKVYIYTSYIFSLFYSYKKFNNQKYFNIKFYLFKENSPVEYIYLLKKGFVGKE